MSKKIKVIFYVSVSGYPDISSNLLYEDIDMLQVLLTELSNNTIADKVIRLISEPYKVTGLLQEVELYPVEKNKKSMVSLRVPLFEDENGIPEVLIDADKLRKIIEDWRIFVKNKKNSIKYY